MWTLSRFAARHASRKPRPANLLVENHRAGKDHSISSTVECGISLQTSEVKSLSAKHADLSSGHVQVIDNEAFLMDVHIPQTRSCLPFHSHLSDRPRKLLMHKKQIKDVEDWIKEKDRDVIPLRFRQGETGWMKVDVGFGERKGTGDEREAEQGKKWKKERTDFLKGCS
ncbi:mitochondrial tmRNA-binding protein SmpB [Andalucia godoyi]|uniref:Mitochondrial tmRNA-binding protein SmpB n=1 Tax=Andalucia godoyi TaxID=505711 RepID=A0A8K0F4K1_ANDGO|nr:mitochondrial tmRNA-binding protein SmpB [Andalucia godoyi]|eukprot:ANDGO_03389.mRNA.1 mitochondrial tmRNA-binding protein SmpB